MPISVKICGLKTPEGVDAAVTGGASFVGFVFFERSPRAISPADARVLGTSVPPAVRRVGLVVDPSDEDLDAVLAGARVDVVQLHGSESPERVSQVRQRFGLPVIKAIPIAGASDVEFAKRYEPVADWLLFDAAPPPQATRPGGNAEHFDWNVLTGRTWSKPWILAGGLTTQSLPQAIARTHAEIVDVSSGVESANGTKSPPLIAAFLAEAARLSGG